MKKALLTEEFHPILEEGLIDLGYYCDNHWSINNQTIGETIKEYNLLVINSKIRVDKKLLDKAIKLETVIRIGSGLEIVDQKACKDKGVNLISTPEGNANAVAEHVLGFILSSFNNLYRAQSELYNGTWRREQNRGEELEGKTISVIGCGNNGSRLVNLLSSFNIKVLVHDIEDVSGSIDNPNARQIESLDEIFDLSDILSMHIPLNKQTKHYVNTLFLERFKKPISFINTSRGEITKWKDIISALKMGTLKRAMIDVFEEEPYQIDDCAKKLMDENKLFLSPHIAGWTKESKKRMAGIAISRLKSLSF